MEMGGRTDVLERTPPAPQEAACEMYSVFHQPLYLQRISYPRV